jgi:hypothetical protein
MLRGHCPINALCSHSLLVVSCGPFYLSQQKNLVCVCVCVCVCVWGCNCKARMCLHVCKVFNMETVMRHHQIAVTEGCMLLSAY